MKHRCFADDREVRKSSVAQDVTLGQVRVDHPWRKWLASPGSPLFGERPSGTAGRDGECAGHSLAGDCSKWGKLSRWRLDAVHWDGLVCKE